MDALDAELDAAARPAGVAVLTRVGASPGMSEVAERHLLARLDEPHVLLTSFLSLTAAAVAVSRRAAAVTGDASSTKPADAPRVPEVEMALDVAPRAGGAVGGDTRALG